MTAKLPTKTSRIAAAAAAGTLVLAGAGSAYAVHANDVTTHNKQVAAAQFAAEQKAVSDRAQADAAAKAAAEKAAADKAAADAAAKAAADKAAADKAAADKAAADKAAADKAAADKAAADQRAAAAAAANRDQQRQPLPTATRAPRRHRRRHRRDHADDADAEADDADGGSYGSAYTIAQSMVPSGQFACFANIVERESGWNVHATNPSSGAYGLGQALPASKMASAGSDWEDNPATQIKWVLSYMDSRYGSPCGAWSFWQSHNWY